jgi:hypothetical protein
MVFHVWKKRGRTNKTKTFDILPILICFSARYKGRIIPSLEIKKRKNSVNTKSIARQK